MSHYQFCFFEYNTLKYFKEFINLLIINTIFLIILNFKITKLNALYIQLI